MGEENAQKKYIEYLKKDKNSDEETLEKNKEKEEQLFDDEKDCCGCGACKAICPMKAIKMVERNGFYYPHVDKEKCIKCKLCFRVCVFRS